MDTMVRRMRRGGEGACGGWEVVITSLLCTQNTRHAREILAHDHVSCVVRAFVGRRRWIARWRE
eukprot:SAG25_NODE_283_length_10420_cov_9.898382_3_plen_64_part_00